MIVEICIIYHHTNISSAIEVFNSLYIINTPAESYQLKASIHQDSLSLLFHWNL